MKKIILILIILLLPSVTFGATYYVTEAGAGAATGADLANASAVATFNAGTAPYDALDGDTVYFCDTLTTGITVPDGGADATTNVVTLRGDYAAHACTLNAMGTGITNNGKNYVVMNGFTANATTTVAYKIYGGAVGVILNDCAITGGCVDGVQIATNSTSVTFNRLTITGNFTNALRIGVAAAGTFTATFNTVTIDGTGGSTAANYVVNQSAEGSTCTINDMTVSNLFATSVAANILNANGSLTLDGLNYTGLGAGDNCQAIQATGATSYIYVYDSIIHDSPDSAIGNIASGQIPVVSRCKFYNNVDHAIHLITVGTTRVDNCLFYQLGSAKYGIRVETAGATAYITNCTFDDTTAGAAGDGCGLRMAIAAGQMYAWNCNFTGLAYGIYQSAGTLVNTNSCMYAVTTPTTGTVTNTNVFTSDPVYTAAGSDYTLTSASPYKDSGLPNYHIQLYPTDIALSAMPQGEGYPIGCYEYVESGRIYGTIQ